MRRGDDQIQQLTRLDLEQQKMHLSDAIKTD